MHSGVVNSSQCHSSPAVSAIEYVIKSTARNMLELSAFTTESAVSGTIITAIFVYIVAAISTYQFCIFYPTKKI